jgi:octaprenyl-diphosphate synthase
MADDLLDYTSNTTVLGKGVGADLKEGKLTLPVIYALKNAASADREKMEKIIKQTDFSVQEFETLLELLEKYEGMAYTQKLAAQCVSSAKEAISFFPNNISKELLLDIADYALIRKA